MHKVGQSGGFLGRLLGPLLKSGLPLIGNVLKPLAKRFNTMRINSSSISNRCSYSEENVWIWHNEINTLAGETIKNEAKNEREDFSESY